MPRDRSLMVAACALLLEMAAIDGPFTDEERESIVASLKKEYGLPDATVDAIVTLSFKEVQHSVDLWQFARTINEHYSADERIRIMEMIWKVVYADGTINEHEDYLAHKMGNLLRLSHHQLMEAKLRIRNH